MRIFMRKLDLTRKAFMKKVASISAGSVPYGNVEHHLVALIPKDIPGTISLIFGQNYSK